MHFYLKATKKWWATALSVVLLLTLPIRTLATDYDVELENLGESIGDLESETEGLETQLSKINEEILQANEELEALNAQIELTESEMGRTEVDLAQSKEDELAQYESMKTRIQYMYEGGTTSLLEVLFGAESITDFINLVDFVNNVTEYDREMLDELTSIREDIEFDEMNLEDEEIALYELQQEAELAAIELQELADSLSIDLEAVLAEIEELQAQEAIIEAEAAEAAAQAAAEAAAQAEAEAAEAAAQAAAEAAEAAAQAEAEAAAQAEAEAEAEANTSTDSSYSASDVELLAALLDCETTENYDAMLAVATVIMNRVNSSKFPNTISGVIYESGQFSPTWTGKLARRLELGASSTAYQVAEDAINGASYSSVSHCYYFLYANSSSRDGIEVGGNVFFTSW